MEFNGGSTFLPEYEAKISCSKDSTTITVPDILENTIDDSYFMKYPDTIYSINNFVVSNSNCPITISIDIIEDGEIEDYTTQDGFEVSTNSIETDA